MTHAANVSALVLDSRRQIPKCQDYKEEVPFSLAHNLCHIRTLQPDLNTVLRRRGKAGDRNYA